MEWLLNFAVAHATLCTVVGSIIAALGTLVLVIAFPTEHRESAIVSASPVGDGGIGYAASFVKTWGVRVAYFCVPLMGVVLASLPLVAPALLLTQ